MPTPRTTPKTKHRAILLRHEMTPEERKLWSCLRNNQLGTSFRRQHAIGPFIVDFCSIKHKLVVEVDGGGHTDQKEYDQARTTYLNNRGYQDLRFWNDAVNRELDAVVQFIEDQVRKTTF